MSTGKVKGYLVTYHRNYCTDCDWSASTETHSRHEIARRTIDHFCETHHTIVSDRAPALDGDTTQ